METARRTREAYDLFASVYARHFAAEAVRLVLPVHDRLLLSSLPQGASILDLCCGAGHLAAALNARGFYVTGIDNSAAMLKEARTNAPRSDFILADVRDFQLPTKFRTALSTFNSLAHIDTEDLGRVFRNVRNALTEGACFAFDLFLEEAYRRRWRESFTVENDHQICSVRPRYDRTHRLATNHIVICSRDSERIAEFTLVQKCHSRAELISALKQAGFREVRVFDGGKDFSLRREHGRAFFLCR
ncbi:MAG TPA: class I SAM-dependent methyltransferase [Clostridia bacterium]|nr:class I SAM-dependent methyltransferase [Clostridia bacterium]